MAGKRKKLTILGVAGLGIILLGAVAMLVLPWKVEVGSRLAQMLEAKGFQGVKLTLSDIGLRRARLQDISIGQETPLVLKNLDIDYTLQDLWRRNIREVTMRGLSLEAVNRNGKWSLVGLENFTGGADTAGTFEIPVSPEDFTILPFETMNIAESTVNIAADQWQVSLPLTVKLEKAGEPKISYDGDHITAKIKDMTVNTGKVELRAQIDPKVKAWQGTWKIDDLVLGGAGIEIPPLRGEGTVTAKVGQVLVNGTFKSQDNAYNLTFMLDERLDGATPSSLTIISAIMPWKGGRVGLKNEKIPLAQTQPLRLDLRVDKVSVNDLMQSLTGKRVSATGLFSGIIPVMIAKDGRLSFPEGALNTEGPGTISMPPEAIPGDGEQLTLVRNILKNFQYAKFSLGINGIDGKGLSVVLALEGNNPDVENGRLVKLNVNLTGDVLDFIRQNAMLFNDPKALLKQSNDEKN